MDGDDNFFLIRNGDISESVVLHSGKRHIEPESLKDGRTKKCWTQYASLHDKRGDNDTLVAEGQDDEQDTSDDEDNTRQQHPVSPRIANPIRPCFFFVVPPS